MNERKKSVNKERNDDDFQRIFCTIMKKNE